MDRLTHRNHGSTQLTAATVQTVTMPVEADIRLTSGSKLLKSRSFLVVIAYLVTTGCIATAVYSRIRATAPRERSHHCPRWMTNPEDRFVLEENGKDSNMWKLRQTNERPKAQSDDDMVYTIVLNGSNESTATETTFSSEDSFSFRLDAEAALALELRFRIEILSHPLVTDATEPLLCQATARIDNNFIGQAPFQFLGQLLVRSVHSPNDSGWKSFQSLSLDWKAGEHELVLGATCNRAVVARVSFDRTLIHRSNPATDPIFLHPAPGTAIQSRWLGRSRTAADTSDPKVFAHMVVDRLRFNKFKDNIRILASFGDRTQGSESYKKADAWVANRLTAYGYTVERAAYNYRGAPRDSIYVTKVGTTNPDRMFIVSAHLDGRGGGGAANDDASGCSLLLETARVLGMNDVTTQVSVRFIFWNNEETGLNGSYEYANKREALQGKQDPPGSGLYPEPTWLGIIQHDQILFDHGLPVQVEQIPNANINIEYLGTSDFSQQSKALAEALLAGNKEYATNYPAAVGNKMAATDSIPFVDMAASVSVRENERIAGIGQGSQPHWHQPTDVYATFSEKDYLFGFNAVQTTLGTVSETVGVRLNLVITCLRTLRKTCLCSAGNDCYETTLADKCIVPSNAQENQVFMKRISKRYNKYCSLRRNRFGN